ncbi:DUF3108 domain-containing protein [Hymenobacter sp. DH14]|uniref:DUF3108 domain-containing protein n=1 Tax=Hymenobacter cyanobacteriorum TaxID=2926463 RepID=A0A9X1VKH7_9BACT|nr:DUF3108 domain-containing protein [Hymenobacter cyanobacteriorum]MCI1187961.1 DUF3108 domain-containing protein [Hymenobacter cyanobacteriorum]
MNRRWLVLTPVIALFLAAAVPALGPGDAVRSIPQNSFGRGETIKYTVHYGLINGGEATVETGGSLERFNGRPCYKASVSGKTTGSFDFFLRIRDQWRALIDTTSILPLRAQREIAEKNYRKRETVDFDHLHDVAEVTDHTHENARTTVKVANNTLELVSGFYYLRTLNFDRMKVGDVVRVPGYFDGDNFMLEVVFKGREVVETKAGDVRAFKLVPRMPNNKLFRGENAISVYFSDDRNKIPVLFQAEMFVGTVKVDMVRYQGLRWKLNMAN